MWEARANIRLVFLNPFLPEYCRELEAVTYYLLGRYHKTLEVVAQLSRVTRRAAAYGVAACVHTGAQEAILESADRMLTIDPEFSVSDFLLTEFYKNRETRDELENSLLKSGLPA